ncbi:hypothetical protein [Actinophytocola sp.]|uniref:hypothetical protein n=1 Tax=Actinophytocola sp. TaxID=1872138 RepID=UPI00389A8662
MNQRITAGVVAALAMVAGLAAVSTTAAGVAVADDGRSGQQSDNREWSSEDASIFTVNYGINSNDSREFGRDFSREFLARDQAARDARDQ